MRLSSAGPSAVIHKRRCCKGVCSSNMYSTLNDNQATLYDRQIRLWGIKTQERSVQSFCQVSLTTLNAVVNSSEVTLCSS